MALFDFLKGKNSQEEKKETSFFSPVNGEYIKIEKVSDPVFSEKMMGDGFAIIPSDGKIYSPGDGKVVSVFPTQHAIGIEFDNGIEVLVHIGVDTVKLQGKPFDTVVEEGQHVTSGTLLSTVDLHALKEAGKEDTMIVIFTNMDAVESIDFTEERMVSHGDKLGDIYAN